MKNLTTLILFVAGAFNYAFAQSQWQWAKSDGFSTVASYQAQGNGIAYSNLNPVNHIVEVGTFNGISLDFNCANLSSAGSWTNSDIYLIKKEANNGNCLFARKMGGNRSDEGNAVTIGQGGRIYFVGRTFDGADFNNGFVFNGPSTSPSISDWFISQCDQGGTTNWLKGYGSVSYDDEANAIALENGTNYGFVTGMERSNVAFVKKVNLSNATTGEWNSTITPVSGTGSEAVGTGIAVDADGSIVATGYFKGTVVLKDGFGTVINTFVSNGGYDFYVIKYRTSGHVYWFVQNGGTGDDKSTGIVSNNIPSYGGVYITGNFNSPTLTFNNSNVGTNCQYSSVTKTNAGSEDFFVCAYTTGLSATDEGCLASVQTYGTSGLEMSNSVTYRTNGGASGPVVTGILKSSNLTVFDMNCSSAPVSATNIFVLKLDQKCELIDSWWYNWVQNSGNSVNSSNGICTDDAGYYYVTGAFGDNLQFSPSINISTSLSNSKNAFAAKIQSLALAGPDQPSSPVPIGTPPISPLPTYQWGGIQCLPLMPYSSNSPQNIVTSGNYQLLVQGNCLNNGFNFVGGYEMDFVTVGPLSCRIANPNTDSNSSSTIFSVQPNPNNGNFLVSFGEDDSKVLEISVYDVSGKLVYKPSIENVSGKAMNIELPENISGMYILNVTTEKQKYHSTIVVQE